MNTTQYNTETREAPTGEYYPPTQAPLTYQQQHAVAARGFAETFGLHPAMALLTFILDVMLFGGELATSGLLIPISLTASIVLGVVVFMAQKKWYGDDNESAFIKALILAGLTAIPPPLPAFLYIPAGVVGLFNRKGR